MTGVDQKATRRLIAIFSVCGFASTFVTRFVDPMTTVLARDLASDVQTVALLSTAFALPYALIQPVLGPVGDALGKVWVMKGCLGLLALTLAAASLAQDITTLLVLRALSGAAAGGIVPLVLASIGDKVAVADRQVAIGQFMVVSITGQLLGGTLAGVLAEWVGWRGVFAVATAIVAGAGLAVVLGFRGEVAERRTLSARSALESYRRIVAIPRARALYAFVFIEGAFVFGIQPYLADLLEARRAGGAAEAGLILGAFAVGGIIFSLLVRRLLRILGLARMLAVAGALAAAAFVALTLRAAWPLDAAAFLLMGIGFFTLHNAFQAGATEVAPDARASAVSLHASSFFLGQAIGPVLFGGALAVVGDTGAKLACGLALLALGLAAAQVLGRAQPRPL